MTTTLQRSKADLDWLQDTGAISSWHETPGTTTTFDLVLTNGKTWTLTTSQLMHFWRGVIAGRESVLPPKDTAS